MVKDDNEVEIVNSVSRQPSTSSKLPTAAAPVHGHESGSWLPSWLGGRRGYQNIDNQLQSKPRKVPVKIEPKVFFANERTFLAWLHMSITLASISIAIIAFAEANSFSQMYGVLLMPVAIAFCAYSLWMYMKRAAMIRRKDPGPYEDKTGPILLASMLGASILINFAVKLYDYST
jgi:uncharacterized membrane protein YidH (DUF202 family)